MSEEEEQTTPEEYQAVASVFANPLDIRRYQEAIANGASEEEALRVGDNGIGAWGDDTTRTDDPIVALSPNTPGFAYNRRVLVSGPKGEVVARIADKGPEGRIDLNPAATMAVGHPGGVIPVTWRYADNTGAPPVSIGPPLESANLPIPQYAGIGGMGVSRLTPIGDKSEEVDDTVGDAADEGFDPLAGGLSGASVGEGGDRYLTAPSPDPPPMSGMKFLGRSPEGIEKWSNGKDHVDVYPPDQSGNSEVRYSIGDEEFVKPNPWTKPTKIKIKDKPFDILVKKAANEGILPEDYKSRAEFIDAFKKAKAKKGSEPHLDQTTGKWVKFDPGTNSMVEVKGPSDNIPLTATGEEALQGLSAEDAQLVRKIANYEIPAQALRSSRMQKLVGRAGLFDTTFDAKEYTNRQKVRADYTSGKSFNNIKSLNTAVGHLNELKITGAALDNGSYQIINSMKNWMKEATGDPSVDKFKTAANAVAGELATVFKGTSGTDQEIKTWHDRISAAKSPAQISAIVDEAINLLGGRLDALSKGYEEGLKKTRDFKILNEKTSAILKSLGHGDLVKEYGYPKESGGALESASIPSGKPPMPVPSEWKAGDTFTDKESGETKTYTGVNPSNKYDPANWK